MFPNEGRFTMGAACMLSENMFALPIASRAAAQARLRFCTCAVSTGIKIALV